MASITPIDQSIKAFLKPIDIPIIDLRSFDDFVQGHIINSSHFPVAKLADRMHEFPKKSQPVQIVGSKKALVQAEQFLNKKGYQVNAAILWDKNFEQQLKNNNLFELGEKSVLLWSPASIVKKFQTEILDKNKIGKALDIACGSGRDSVYLSQNGWQVHAVDYQSEALSKVNALAKRHQTDVICDQIDLEKEPEELKKIGGKFQLVLIVRYLHRPLLNLIKQQIAPGGYLVYQTFLRGCEHFTGPKKDKFLLEEGELASLFADFEIHIDEIEYLDDGRPTNIFIAQKCE